MLKSKEIFVRKIIYTLLSFCLLYPINVCFAASEPTDLFSNLPEVAQDSDVHSLSSAYCKALWGNIKTKGNASTFVDGFSDKFSKTVAELGVLIENIKNALPILVGAQINLSGETISDSALLEMSSYFYREAYATLKIALTSMSVLNKHKGGADFDSETKAHVSEILVYVWEKIKTDPERLQAFLIGLIDAAPTCIQGYSVRMLCAVHPPKLKTVIKK